MKAIALRAVETFYELCLAGKWYREALGDGDALTPRYRKLIARVLSWTTGSER